MMDELTICKLKQSQGIVVVSPMSQDNDRFTNGWWIKTILPEFKGYIGIYNWNVFKKHNIPRC